MDEKENITPEQTESAAPEQAETERDYSLDNDSAKLAEVEQIIDFYKDKPLPEDERENEPAEDDKGISQKLISCVRNILHGKPVVAIGDDTDGELHDAEYGIDKKKRLILSYVITAALCAAVIGGAFLLSAILPGDEEETARYAETLRAEEDYTTLKSDYDKLSEETAAKRDEVAEKKERSENIDDYENTQAELRSKVADAQARLSELNTSLSEKQGTLDSLNAQIADSGSNAISLPPGRYTVGTDIAAGKYSVTGTGSFAAAAEDNTSKCNVTLGSSPYEITLNQGDKLKFDSTVKFTPVN